MMGHTIEEKINLLREKINNYNHHYYLRDDPLVSDFEYDETMRELKSLEEEYPEYASDDSPTQKVGGGTKNSFLPVAHTVQMASLQDAFSVNEILEFDKRVREKILNPQYVVEPKIDGLSVSLEYANGKFFRGSTRGDGHVGEDVTENLKTVRGIPLVLKYPVSYLEVRGEAFIARKDFEQLLSYQIESGEKPFKNSRNAAAGSLRQKDPSVTDKRKLSVSVFNIQQVVGIEILTHAEALLFMERAGFSVVSGYCLVDTIEDAIQQIDRINKKRDKLTFDIDGAVVKLNSFSSRDLLGATSKFPRWAIAFKYPPEEKETRIRSIEVQVGRTGVLTPIAVFEPVTLAGTTVTRAVLHNQDFINEKQIGIGDRVLVRKAGEIIPEVVSVVKRIGSEIFKLPDNCPSCGSRVVQLPGDAAVRCMNMDCPAQLLRHIIHFASRDAMNIEGLGESVAALLLKNKLIGTAADLYNLDSKDIAKLSRMGEKSANNLAASIEISKTRGLSRLMYALGIKNVGLRAATLLAERFGNIENIMNAKIPDMSEIDGIGNIIAFNVSEFFAREHNRSIVNKLKEVGVLTEIAAENAKTGSLSNKTFVLTGVLSSMPRSKAEDLIEAAGGRVSESVSKRTNFIIAGENAGSKLTKGISLNIPILDEEMFLKLVGMI